MSAKIKKVLLGDYASKLFDVHDNNNKISENISFDKLYGQAFIDNHFALAKNLEIYRKTILQTPLVLIPFMTHEEKESKIVALKKAIYFFYGHKQLHNSEQLARDIDKGLELIACLTKETILTDALTAHNQRIQDQRILKSWNLRAELQTQWQDFVAYCQAIQQSSIDELALRFANNLRAGISYINMHRLYWVWGAGIIAAMMDTLRLGGIIAVNFISKIGGILSYVLYVLRSALAFVTALDEAMNASPLAEQIPFSTRLRVKLSAVKFGLLNDGPWGVGNLLGNNLWTDASKDVHGELSWKDGWNQVRSASILNGLLLMMDLALTLWRYYEDKEHYDFCLFNSNDPHHSKYLEIEKRHNQKSTLNDIFCAASFVIVFMILCVPLIPGVGVSCLAFNLIGNSLSFLVTLISTGIQGDINTAKNESYQHLILKQRNKISSERQEGSEEDYKWQCFDNDYLYNQELAAHETYYAAANVFRKLLFAVVFIVTAHYAPLIILAVTLAGMVAVFLMIEKAFNELAPIRKEVEYKFAEEEVLRLEDQSLFLESSESEESLLLESSRCNTSVHFR